MFRHSVASTFALFASVVLSGLLLIAATPFPVHAAEIKLLGPASFRVLFPKLHHNSRNRRVTTSRPATRRSA